MILEYSQYNDVSSTQCVGTFWNYETMNINCNFIMCVVENIIIIGSAI